MSKLILLCGVSGTGKTYARTHLDELKDLPFVDVADVYREFGANYHDWFQVHTAACARVWELMKVHPVVVLEGCYLPYSTTRRYVADQFKDVDVESWFFHAPKQQCIEGIVDGNVEARMLLLTRLWPRADRFWLQKYEPLTGRAHRVAVKGETREASSAGDNS